MNVQSESTTWFEEVDLDPAAEWLRMGTRQLGPRPWLIVDQHRDDELAIKGRLYAQRHDEVFAVQPDAVEPSREILALVTEELHGLGVTHAAAAADGSLHPLEAAGRLVQEDLCLLRRDAIGWVLAGASLCFPSRWRLAEKMSRTLTEVHQPVEGYDPKLAGRVDSLFDRLDTQTVWRRNWFIHPSDALFQPDRPIDGDPTIEAQDCLTHLVVRSERQTLRRLDRSGWILFTVRIQQASLGRFLEDAERGERFRQFLEHAPQEHIAHRGLSREQVDVLRLVIAP